MGDKPEDAVHATDKLPRHTTPTWEVELLISGVAVFAMLQLPGWLDTQYFLLVPRFAAEWRSARSIVHMYLTSAAIILAVTFFLHLLLRARWIALVGMQSVYPTGIRWDRLRMGPLRRSVEQVQSGTSADAVERADNQASILFAVGVSLASMMLLLGLVAALVCGVSISLALALGLPIDPAMMFLAVFAVIMAPLVLAQIIDHRWGNQLDQNGRAQRMLSAVFRCYARLHVGRQSHAMLLLSSHGGQRRVTMLVTGLVLVAVVTAMVNTVAQRHPRAFGSYDLFPAQGMPRGLVLDQAHYDDQRDPVRDPAVPYVQSVVVTDAYLKLVVPYRPARDAAGMLKTCTKPAKQSDENARSRMLLQCLAQLHPFTLDGNALAGAKYFAASDPRTHRPALQAMIDVRGLTPGRHELRIKAARREGHPDDPDTYLIPFWR